MVPLLRRFVSVQDHEVATVLYGFFTLFCLLASYFVVVPLREDAGIALGTDMLPKLFTGSLLGVLLVTPLTTVFLSRPNVQREASLRQFYALIATILLGFYILYYISTVQAQATLRHFAHLVSSTAERGQTLAPPLSHEEATVKGGDPSLDGFQKLVRIIFYVFINVQNLIAISAIWARCADVFTAEAASRLFGFISAGATAGQLVGSLVTASAAGMAGKGDGPVYGLIFFSAMLMYCAAYLSAKVQKPGGRKHLGSKAEESDRGEVTASAAGAARSQLAQLLQGFTLIARSRYLLLLCGYLMMTYVVGSLMYFQRSVVIATVMKDTNSRTAFFATVYSLSAFLIILLQMFATGRMLKVVGITVALASLPLTCAVLIAGIGLQPTTTAVALGEVVRKLLGYSLVRPAREVLFTVVSREEKYRAKLTIDAVVQRLGDTVAAFVFEILDVRLHLGQQVVALAGVAACLLWCYWSLSLGTQQKALAAHALSAASGSSGQATAGIVGMPGSGGAGVTTAAMRRTDSAVTVVP